MSLTKGSGIGFAKVLIAGGYLILEPENRGLSLCYSSANIETTLLVSEESSTNDDLHTISINVTNITFPEESKNYVLEITGDHPEIFKNTKLFMKRSDVMELTLIPRENYGIIEYSLVVPFLYTYRKKCFKFQMLIMADPKFYTSSQLIDPDSNTNFPKVGLGSSSALIVSIVASIVNYFHCASTEKKQLCHALAQYVNFLVQKKEGSGYDISAATYGNIIYKRPIFSFANFPESDFPKFIKEAIFAWGISTQEIRPECSINGFQLPTDLKLALFKFSTYGSKTVPMITNLRSWLDLNDPEKSLWNQWKIHSDDFIASFLQVLSAPLIDFLKIPKLQELYKRYTDFLQKLTDMSNIPIYPKETRQVIEVINSVPGIIMAGHPGAGGYDAIFVLYSISNGCTTALETIQEIMHRYETPFIHIN